MYVCRVYALRTYYTGNKAKFSTKVMCTIKYLMVMAPYTSYTKFLLTHGYVRIIQSIGLFIVTHIHPHTHAYTVAAPLLLTACCDCIGKVTFATSSRISLSLSILWSNFNTVPTVQPGLTFNMHTHSKWLSPKSMYIPMMLLNLIRYHRHGIGWVGKDSTK